MNKIQLLKQFLPGLLPLFVFIIADEIWGTQVGMYVAIGFGIAQLIIIYFKEKRLDSFVILDTLLITVMGGISIILENEIFFKLKPALIGLIFCSILAISAFTKVDIMLAMSKRYMNNMTLNDTQIKAFKNSQKVLFFIFFIHTLLVFYSAFYMSKEAWAFISGGLFYIIFGGYFLFEFIKNKIRTKQIEWFPLVDNEGKVIGKAPRHECHSNNTLLHPVVHLHVFNSKNELYLQKRPSWKDVQPDKWDTAVGGHISINETIEKALKRESNEELNLNSFNPVFITKYVWKSDVESELVFSHYTIIDEQINYNKNELADGKFWKISDIKSNIGKNIFTPNFENEFTILQKLKLI